jgi:serine phosphatase RsbU (regulator of sigma subunit)
MSNHAQPPASGQRILEAIEEVKQEIGQRDTTTDPDLIHRLQLVEAAIRDLERATREKRAQVDTQIAAYQQIVQSVLEATAEQREGLRKKIEHVELTADKLDGDVVGELKKMRHDMQDLTRTINGVLDLVAGEPGRARERGRT